MGTGGNSLSAGPSLPWQEGRVQGASRLRSTFLAEDGLIEWEAGKAGNAKRAE